MSDEFEKVEKKLLETEAKEKALNAVLDGEKTAPDGVDPKLFNRYKEYPPENPAKVRDDLQATIAALEHQKASLILGLAHTSWSRVHGTPFNFRGMAGLRERVVRLAIKTGAQGVIGPPTTGNKNLDIDVYFNKNELAGTFEVDLQLMVESAKGLVSMDIKRSVNVAKPRGVSLVEAYQKHDDNLDIHSASSPTSSKGCSQLPAESPSICKHRKYEQVVHLVPRAILPKHVKDSSCPWLVIGGPHQLNEATDAIIPEVEFAVQHIGEGTVRMDIECADAEVFDAIYNTVTEPERTGELSLFVSFECDENYRANLEKIVEWRQECHQKAKTRQKEGTLGHPNARSKDSPWYKLVELPAGILPPAETSSDSECDGDSSTAKRKRN